MNHLSTAPTSAKDVMDSDALPLSPGKFEKDLALQFLSGQYCGWPVVDATGQLIGIVTDLRLFQAVSRLPSLDELKVEDTMTAPVSVSEHESLETVLQLMTARHVQRMPVVSDQHLVGVLSRAQVLPHGLRFPTTSSVRLVSSCAWCERVQDPSAASAGTNGGRDLASVLAMDPLKFSEIGLAQTYCPSCVQTLEALHTTSGSLPSGEMETLETRPSVLVVDDDPSVAGLLTHALQEWGYAVRGASNGWEGLAVASRHRLDGILLDLHMPMMDGQTMLDELRWLGHQVPVLMMSGGADERALRQLLQEGAQGFFMKPFQLSSLKQACRQVFAREPMAAQTSAHVQVAGSAKGVSSSIRDEWGLIR